MAAPQLRVYPISRGTAPEVEREPMVKVSLGELLPLIALAHRKNYVWLKDFLDDEVAITEDLHEILQTFGGSRPAAG